MLILLPPSEGKVVPTSGPRLVESTLAWPELATARRMALDALVDLCCSSPRRARTILGVSAKQVAVIEANAKLRTAPTASAMQVYSGVLYQALDFGALPAPVRARGLKRIAIASALWGLVRPDDRIPAYRFSADSRIPGLAPLPQLWATPVGDVISKERGLIIDLRSSAYQKLAPIPTSCAQRAVSLRILHEQGGRLTVVTHHNKATKGRITASLLHLAKAPSTIDALVDVLQTQGYPVTDGQPTGSGMRLLDVVVRTL